MLVLSLFAAGTLAPALHKRIVVMEAFGEDLNYSLLQCYNAASVERTGRHTYPMLGVDSRVNVIARYTVDYVNSAAGCCSTRTNRKRSTAGTSPGPRMDPPARYRLPAFH
jgi:hypothetical protein